MQERVFVPFSHSFRSSMSHGWLGGRHWRGGARAVIGLLIVLLAGGADGRAQSQPESRWRASDTLSAASVERVRATSRRTGLPTRIGDTVVVRGRASVGTGGLPDSSLIFLQDETAGIAVGMPEGPVVRRGDSLWVKGVIQQQFGLTRIEGVQYGRVNVLTRYPEPIPLTVSAAASEVYEGQLVEVRGRVVSNQMNEGGQFVLLADPVPYAEARVTIFVPRRRLDEVSLDRFESGDRVAVTGVLRQSQSRVDSTG